MCELLDRIDDAICTTMGRHESLRNDSVCTCGVPNNWDGDVLFSHRWGVVADAVRNVLGEMHREERTLPDGAGGISTNYKTGVTTVHNKAATRQDRWATEWINSCCTYGCDCGDCHNRHPRHGPCHCVEERA